MAKNAVSVAHSTNETVIGHLVGPGDLVLHDALARPAPERAERVDARKRLARFASSVDGALRATQASTVAPGPCATNSS